MSLGKLFQVKTSFSTAAKELIPVIKTYIWLEKQLIISDGPFTAGYTFNIHSLALLFIAVSDSLKVNE